MSKTKTVFHPHLPNVSYDVPEGDAQGWKEQGWRLTDPKLPEPVVEFVDATVEAPASK